MPDEMLMQAKNAGTLFPDELWDNWNASDFRHLCLILRAWASILNASGVYSIEKSVEKQKGRLL